MTELLDAALEVLKAWDSFYLRAENDVAVLSIAELRIAVAKAKND